jgi:hypothetical protein
VSDLTLGLNESTVARIRAAFATDRPEPVAVDDALPLATARGLLAAFRAVRSWRREYFVEEFLGATQRVSEHEFAAAPAVTRFATWDTVALNDLDGEPELTRVLGFLSSASFLDTLRRLGRAGVKPPTFKLRRYGPDDFFGSHCDGDEGLGLLIHLTDPPWQDGDGGRLIYEPSTGGELQMPPRFNSAVFLPYALSATHRVEPVAPHGAIRYTLGCDYA